ncbi:MAG: hypothetical protein M1832_004441 [Thelocarpon impressellum]|nr:MAG: hypothetical protein M1832_004441 [Thelocarpon impressellum]
MTHRDESPAPTCHARALHQRQAARSRREALNHVLNRFCPRVALTHPDTALPGMPRVRSAPPPPTPLEFAHFIPSTRSIGPFTSRSSKDVERLFRPIRKPTDISSEHFEALNLDVHTDVSLEELLPSDAASFLPPGAWDEPRSSDSVATPKRLLSNGREAPGEELYRQRKSELDLDNEDAFRAVLRDPPAPGRTAVKPGYFYKFWQSLELMSQYWDTSMDRCEDGEVERNPGDMDVDEARAKGYKYSGRRLGSGREMPESYREEAVKRLVETMAWLFGCQISPPRVSPRVTLQTTLFPVRITQSVYRVPSDRQVARQGILEGPIIGVQCRPETSLREPTEAPGEGQGEKLDLLREIGALLLIAQERSREGRQEKLPGEGKWYTSTPRWGGGPGGEVGNTSAANTDEEPLKEAGGKNASTRRGGSSSTRARKGSMAEAYKKVAPGAGIWDPKVRYTRFGKDASSAVDDVFLVSSLNHHVSILRLRVSAAYLAFLETGALPSSPDRGGDEPWYVLRLHRTRWLDLFVAADRMQAMRALWGVLAYQMRAMETAADVEMTG